MSVLGIGGPELILILVLFLLILGPEHAPRVGRALGKQLRALTRSEVWQAVSQMGFSIRNLPQALIKLAEVEELQSQLAEDVARVRQEVEAVSEPIKGVLDGGMVRQELEAMEAEVRQSLSQDQQAPARARADAEPPEEALATPASADAEQPTPATPAPDASDNGDLVADEEAPEPEPALSGDRSEWPAVLDRLSELERNQAQLIDQVQSLRESVDSILSLSTAKADLDDGSPHADESADPEP
jgi:Sec-independent protein translocase protein TatA